MNPLAWENSVELPNGTIASYWVLTLMTVNMQSAKAIVSYHGYVSEAKFAADPVGNKILEKHAEIDFSSFDKGGALAAGVVSLVRAAEGSV